MLVTLDGRRLDDRFSPAAALHELIDQVRAVHLPDRLVVGVAINGRELIDDELQARLAVPIEAGAQIDLESGDARQVAADALRDSAAQLEAAADEQVQIADTLQAGSTSDAVQQFSAVLDTWHGCRRTLTETAALLRMRLEHTNIGGRPVGEHLVELVNKLRELRDAFDARDFVLLADLLRHEMPGLCRSWAKRLRELAEYIADGVIPGEAETIRLAHGAATATAP
ncbi:MAG: hypothetical protein HRF50_12530 [Phycisphaerae bacterium]